MRKHAHYTLLAVALSVCGHASAQIIETVVGGNVRDGGPASEAALNAPYHLAVSPSGELYITDSLNHRVRRVDPGTGLISTVAGTGESGYSGDGGPATAARLRSPQGVAVDAAGNVLISEYGNGVIRRVDRGSGTITTIAGTGASGFGGDGGPATQARFNGPSGMAFTPSGDLLVADTVNRRVRRISGGVVSTLAGTGADSSTGDGGPATAASFRGPAAVLVLASGDILVADAFGNTVRRIAASTGAISAFAGNGTSGSAGDNGPATAASMNYPYALAADLVGNVLIADRINTRIRRVSGGTISTITGPSAALPSGDGGPASAAAVGYVSGLAVGPAGETYVADQSGRVRVISGFTTVISRLVGPAAAGDGGPARQSTLRASRGVAKSATRLYVTDFGRVRAVDLASGVITTVAGNGSQSGSVPADGSAATSFPMNPYSLALEASGNLLIADLSRLFRLNVGSGTLSTVAGGGSGGDGGPAATAALSGLRDVAVDAAGNILLVEQNARRVRRISATSGTISTIAGTGASGGTGDGGPATLATFNLPGGLALDADGNAYVADLNASRVRRIDAATGVITHYAGSGGSNDSGDGGPATAAVIFQPQSLEVEANGDLLITSFYRLRRVSKATGRISTVAGRFLGFSGDGGPASQAEVASPSAVIVDAGGTIYFSDDGNNRVRAISCSVTQGPELLLPPSGDTASSGTVLLTWSPAPFAGRYDVRLDTVNPPVKVVAQDVTGTSFTASGLIASATYYWSVTAKNDPGCGSASSAASAVRSFHTPSACAEVTDRQVCLGGERFVVKGTYRLEGGGSGALRFTRLTNESAYFVFDNPGDAQALVKVLSVCFPPFNAHWVFVGALTDQEVHLTVTDSKTGAVKSYSNPLKTPFAPIQDTEAFKTCP